MTDTPTTLTTLRRPYAEGVLAYGRAGWPCILPVPPDKKWPPPVGFTGAEGRDPDPVQMVTWATTHADQAIVLRMPDGVIGIDVDHYDKTSMTADGPKTVQKRGADTLAELEARWGPLPPTWSSTARGDDTGPGPSRIMFFRVPPGRYTTKLGDAIEIIQRHHRYAVVAPSVHSETGTPVRWYGPDDRPTDAVPSPAGLTDLPEAWVRGLAEGATEAGPVAADIASGYALLQQLQADARPPCAEVASAALTARSELTTATAGGRHDAATARVHHLVQLGAKGHPGVGTALEEVRQHWSDLTAGEARGDEFERMVLSSARKAVSALGGRTRQVDRDPCLTVDSLRWRPPVPADDRPDEQREDTEAPQAPQLWNVREVIGAHLFDPQYDLDQTLAETVLQRVWPAVRHAYDANTWLLRGPDRWEARGDLAGWAVAELAKLMPTGDPDAEKGTAERRRADRRKRMMTTAGANAVAAKARALVSAGTHPCSLELATLDADPELLWAGGLAWNLRAGTDRPALAGLDPSTPHLHSAGFAPDPDRPTPLWDAFLAAVWPDKDIREWALRVLAVAVTGYPDAALPILLGETRRGKSQVVALLMSVLGTYAHAADPRLLGAEQAHASIVYALKGRRLSFIDEGPRRGHLAQERLKQLTGGTELTGNRMRENPVTFMPSHTLVLTANPEAEVSLTDAAIRARVRLIPCDGDPERVRLTREAIGSLRGAAWRTEAPGVLAAMMREAARWLADRASASTAEAPASIRFLAEHIAEEQDPVRTWVTSETVADEEGVRSSDLHKAFVAWCRDAGIRNPPSMTKWGTDLNKLGYPAKDYVDGRRRPLRLRAPGGWDRLLPQTLSGSPLATPNTVAPEALRFWGERDGGKSQYPEESGAPRPQDPSLDVDTRLAVAVTESTGSLTAPGGLLEGSGGFARQPSSGEVARSEAGIPESAGGLEGSSRSSTPTFENKDHIVDDHEDIKISGEYGRGLEPSSRSPEFRPASSTNTGPGGFGQPSSHEDPQEVPNTESPTSGVNPSKPGHVTARTGRGQVSVDKELIRAQERQSKIDQAAGEPVGLPAIVTRSGDPRPIALDVAGAVLATIITRTGALTVDVETTGYPVGHCDYALRTIQLGDDQAAIVFDAADPEQTRIAALALGAAPRLHAHSATADLVPLAHAGLVDANSAWRRMHDTVIPAKLADPASTGSDPGLKQLAQAMLHEHAAAPAADAARAALFKAGRWLTDTKATTPVARSGWAQVDMTRATMVRYGASDVLDTAALARVLPAPDPAVTHRERTAQRMTARVAHQGLRIDGDHVVDLLAKHTAEREAAGKRVQRFGVENPGSDRQIAAALTECGAQLPRTAPSSKHPEGQPSVAEGVLDPLLRQHPDGSPVHDLVRAVLDYRHHDTAIGTFLEPYQQLVQHGDGRARPTVYTLAADTGRMSCVRPNLQQVPRQGGFRACITADPGHLLVSADFAGVELRVAAALSGDANLRRMLAEGVDLHWEIARQVWGPDATKADRYAAKRVVFGRLYGGGVPTLARQAGVPEELAASAVDALDAMTPGLSAWSAAIRSAVKQGRTQFPAYSGRIIHLPAAYPHKGPNFAIQGSARELLVDALMRWSDTRWGAAVLLPVHDEIVVVVPEAEATDALAALVAAMETDLFGVQIKAEASTPSFAWADSA